MLSVTNDYNITKAIFTITRDNASNNTVILAEFEKASSLKEYESHHPWYFTVKEGDVRYVAYIINLVVQAALTSLKAIPFV